MSCHGNNATAPGPAIAPGGEATDPRAAADRLLQRTGGLGVDPRLPALVPGFDAPFFQAGLAGYSDAAMRIVARRHGCPFCVTEALLDRTLLAGGRGFAKADLGELHDNVPGGEEDHPIAGQIMGSEPAEMAASAVMLVDQGRASAKAYRKMAYVDGIESRGHFERADLDAAPNAQLQSDAPTFQVVDVNLACPVKKIAKKARGGHWLAQPEGAIAILEAVREALPAEIVTTVKMRRAFDDTPEMAEAFDRIFDAAYRMGYAWVTVHGRTVEQKYVGPSRWDLLRDIVKQHNAGGEKLIFGSGDIWNAGDIFRMIDYTGLTGASVARGCIGNPWIFRQARQMLAGEEPTAPTIAEQRLVLETHFELALKVNARFRNPENHTGKMMRKFGIRFAAHHPDSEAVIRRMREISSPGDWRSVLDEHYS